MLIPLERKAARFLFGMGILLFSALYLAGIGKVWRADAWSRSQNPANWQRAARLEPRDADYWHHLGLFKEWDPQRGNLGQAAAYLQRATEIDPWSDTYWMDLAEIDEALGKRIDARAAYDQAERARPDSPEVAWQFGGYLLRSGDVTGATAQLRRALHEDPSRVDNALKLSLRAGLAVPAILDDILPADSRDYQNAIDYFVSAHNASAAMEVWHRWVQLPGPFAMSSVLPLTDELTRADQIPEAEKTWRQALEKSHWPQSSANGASLLFNGGFEEDLLEGGFDWRTQQTPNISIQDDSSVVHSGARSLRITLDGTVNLNFQNLVQFVGVEPSQRYHFSAYLRTDRITTDSGFGFLLFDPFHPTVPPVETTSLTGTHPWTLVEADIATGPESNLLEVLLLRRPSEKFDNKVGGTVWVDDVSLVPASADTKASPR